MKELEKQIEDIEQTIKNNKQSAEEMREETNRLEKLKKEASYKLGIKKVEELEKNGKKVEAIKEYAKTMVEYGEEYNIRSIRYHFGQGTPCEITDCPDCAKNYFFGGFRYPSLLVVNAVLEDLLKEDDFYSMKDKPYALECLLKNASRCGYGGDTLHKHIIENAVRYDQELTLNILSETEYAELAKTIAEEVKQNDKQD